jgi:transposase
MGFFYDWIEQRWSPIDHDRRLTPEARRRLERRTNLIEQLIAELEDSRDGVAVLYAGLLARRLASSDEILIRQFSKTLARLATHEQTRKTAA